MIQALSFGFKQAKLKKKKSIIRSHESWALAIAFPQGIEVQKKLMGKFVSTD